MSDAAMKQSMEQHEHGLRFVDDEGRCLACSVIVRDKRIAKLEEAVCGRDKTIERLMNEWPADHKFPKGLMEKDRPEATT